MSTRPVSSQSSLWQRRLTRRDALRLGGVTGAGLLAGGGVMKYRRDEDASDEVYAQRIRHEQNEALLAAYEPDAIADIAQAAAENAAPGGLLAQINPVDRMLRVYTAPYEPALERLNQGEGYSVTDAHEPPPKLESWMLRTIESVFDIPGMPALMVRKIDDPEQAHLIVQQANFPYDEGENVLTRGKIWLTTGRIELPESGRSASVIGLNEAEKNMKLWIVDILSGEAEYRGPTWLRLQLVEALFDCMGVPTQRFQSHEGLLAFPVQPETDQWMREAWMTPDGLWKLDEAGNRVIDRYTDLAGGNWESAPVTKPIDAGIVARLLERELGLTVPAIASPSARSR